MEKITTDICIIGAGSGGLSVAAGAAQLGARVVLVEGGEMGGDCLNAGCVPSKALLAAAKAAQAMRSGAGFGITPVAPQIDFAAVKDHVARVIATIAPVDSQERFEAMGVRVIRAWGAFTSASTLVAGGVQITARRFVIATGSRPLVPPIPGLATSGKDGVPYLTNETIFALRDRPDHLIIIGGGPIGMEMAQAHRRLGCAVTVIEAARALARDDPEAAALVLDTLRAEGVTVLEGAKVASVAGPGQAGPGQAGAGPAVAGPAVAGPVVAGPVEVGQGVAGPVEVGPPGSGPVEAGQVGAGQVGAVRVALEDGREVAGSHLLLAVGRQVTLEGLNLQAAGVDFTRKGVTVDDRLRSSNRRIYAVGDAAGGLQFTHVAGYHAGIVVRQAVLGLPAKATTRHIPWATYTDPELAQVGLTEAQARAAHGAALTLARAELHHNDRAQTEGKTTGFIKVMIVRGRPVGVTLVGPQAAELVALWALILSQRLKMSAVAGMVAPYPTLGEVSKRAASAYFSPKLFDNAVLKQVVRLVQRHLP